MHAHWIEVIDTNGSRREALTAEPLRLGGGDATVTVDGVGSDQLVIESDPLRATFVGSGSPPSVDGAPFRERDCATGETLEWGGVRIVFGAEAALEEIAEGASDPGKRPRRARRSNQQRAWSRVRAGLLIDLELADPRVVKRWQRSVVDGDFDADACAAEVVESAKGADDQRLVQRSGQLLRDFLMAPMLRGVRGAGRAARTRVRGGVAFAVAQLTALLVYSVIVVLSMLFLRIRGISFDEFYDGILDFFRSFAHQ